MKTETRSFYETAVERTVIHIARTLDDALDLTAIAKTAALSPFHFHRVFRGMVGETPLEMHRRLRLERAAQRLLETDVAITAIAFDAGYETHEAFTRAFRVAYGISPTNFRHGDTEPRSECVRLRQIELAAPSGVHFEKGSPKDPTISFVSGGPIMDVTIEQRAELRVAAVHHVGPYNRISEAFQRLHAIAEPAGLQKFPDTAMLAVYYDDPESKPADQLEADAGITVPEGVPLHKGLVEKRIPAGRYAHTTHVGPYSRLGDTWSRLMGEWLPKSGHRVGEGPSYEVYRNTPMNAPPEELRTELYLPLA